MLFHIGKLSEVMVLSLAKLPRWPATAAF